MSNNKQQNNMKATHKKQLKDILSKIEELKSVMESFSEEHQDWMDEHDYGWEDTPSGERASNEQCELEDITGTLENITEQINNILEGNI